MRVRVIHHLLCGELLPSMESVASTMICGHWFKVALTYDCHIVILTTTTLRYGHYVLKCCSISGWDYISRHIGFKLFHENNDIIIRNYINCHIYLYELPIIMHLYLVNRQFSFS